VRVVEQAVEDGVSEGGVTDNVVPVLDGELGGEDGSSPDSPVQAPQELSQLVPVPPFFEKLPLQLDPHRHLPQLRPGPHQLPSRPILLLQPLLATVQELPPPPLQLRRRNPNLPAHLADLLTAQQPQHHLGLPLRAPPLRQDLPAVRGSSPGPALPISETIPCASSPLDPGWMAKLLSREIGGIIVMTRSDGCDWLHRPFSERARRDAELKGRIVAIWIESRGVVLTDRLGRYE